MHTLITNNLHRHLEVSPEAATAALRHLDPLRPLSDALTALGLTHQVSVRRTGVPAASAAERVTLTLSLTCRLARANQAHVVWTLAVAPAGDGDSLLSITVRAAGDSPTADRQLFAAWTVLRPVLDSYTLRLLRAVNELAEHLEGTSLDQAPVPLSAAA